MISRRFFLKGMVATAAGLILPSWVVHAERYIEGEGVPFLESLDSHQDILYSIDGNGEGGYGLFLGDPFKKPQTQMTWEEYIEKHPCVSTLQEFFEYSEREDIPKPDDLVGESELYHVSEYWENPSRLAYRFLENLDLGPELVEIMVLEKSIFMMGYRLLMIVSLLMCLITFQSAYCKNV
jgi:hypothetical protein